MENTNVENKIKNIRDLNKGVVEIVNTILQVLNIKTIELEINDRDMIRVKFKDPKIAIEKLGINFKRCFTGDGEYITYVDILKTLDMLTYIAKDFSYMYGDTVFRSEVLEDLTLPENNVEKVYDLIYRVVDDLVTLAIRLL